MGFSLAVTIPTLMGFGLDSILITKGKQPQGETHFHVHYDIYSQAFSKEPIGKK